MHPVSSETDLGQRRIDRATDIVHIQCYNNGYTVYMTGFMAHSTRLNSRFDISYDLVFEVIPATPSARHTCDPTQNHKTMQTD